VLELGVGGGVPLLIFPNDASQGMGLSGLVFPFYYINANKKKLVI